MILAAKNGLIILCFLCLGGTILIADEDGKNSGDISLGDNINVHNVLLENLKWKDYINENRSVAKVSRFSKSYGGPSTRISTVRASLLITTGMSQDKIRDLTIRALVKCLTEAGVEVTGSGKGSIPTTFSLRYSQNSGDGVIFGSVIPDDDGYFIAIFLAETR